VSGAPSSPRYWFPAKRHGWGCGWPATWQGWAVIATLSVVLVAGEVTLPPFPPHPALAVHLVYASIVTWSFIGICYLKGEPPHRRWGSD
jgi:hypothetical protein